MTPLLAGIIGIVVMLILILVLRVPICIAMALPGMLGAIYLMGTDAAWAILRIVPFSQTFNFVLTTIPMFVLMGEIIYFSGISKELFSAFHKFLGQLPGGVAMATIAACGGFAAACGSSMAGAATMGSVALPEMLKLKYDKGFASGTVAAGGTLGILIPPSTAFIIYGTLAEESIGKLFTAGIIPGIILVFLFIVTIYFRAVQNPKIAPRAAGVPWKEKIASLKGVVAILILFVVVIGGIYLGIFTPSEAGGTGACLAFVIALAKRGLPRQGFINALRVTLRTTCMIFAILIGAMIFNYFLTVSRLPITLADFTSSLPIPPLAIVACILLVYLMLGCVMDALAMIIITIPIFLPTILALGFDKIWFGVLIVIMMETAFITPPIGMNCYVLSGVAPDVSLEEIFRGTATFLPALVIAVLAALFFPQLSLFLPGTMR